MHRRPKAPGDFDQPFKAEFKCLLPVQAEKSQFNLGEVTVQSGRSNPCYLNNDNIKFVGFFQISHLRACSY